MKNEALEFFKDIVSIVKQQPRHLDRKIFDPNLSVEDEAQLPPFQQIVHLLVCEEAQDGINPWDRRHEYIKRANQIFYGYSHLQ